MVAMKKFVFALFAIAVAGFGFVAATSARAAEAKENWGRSCAVCHGGDGKGKASLHTKDYTGAAAQGEVTDEAAFKAIKEGFKPAKGPAMKAFGDKLSDDEIRGLVAYVRGLKK